MGFGFTLGAGILGFGFWMLKDFRIWILGFGFWILGHKGLGCEVLGSFFVGSRHWVIVENERLQPEEPSPSAAMCLSRLALAVETVGFWALGFGFWIGFSVVHFFWWSGFRFRFWTSQLTGTVVLRVMCDLPSARNPQDRS